MKMWYKRPMMDSMWFIYLKEEEKNGEEGEG